MAEQMPPVLPNPEKGLTAAISLPGDGIHRQELGVAAEQVMYSEHIRVPVTIEDVWLGQDFGNYEFRKAGLLFAPNEICFDLGPGDSYQIFDGAPPYGRTYIADHMIKGLQALDPQRVKISEEAAAANKRLEADRWLVVHVLNGRTDSIEVYTIAELIEKNWVFANGATFRNETGVIQNVQLRNIVGENNKE